MRGSQQYLYSREGMAQGGPISLFKNALGTLSLIQQLKNPGRWPQVWYADDSSACGKLSSLRDWLTMLMEKGPDFGYFPKPSKKWLIMNASNTNQANQLFGEFGLQIATGGRLQGGIVGDKASMESFVKEKVQEWRMNLQQLLLAATTQPQAAYCAFMKSLQSEWIFYRVWCQDLDGLLF